MSGCTAAMDVLTSAASAHEAASETHSSGETSQISSEAQILALKRKLIECDQESRDQRERIAGLEKALEIEKREHQLTTSKLTMLLNKRRASDAQCDQRRADMAGFESSPAWLASMRSSAHPPAAEASTPVDRRRFALESALRAAVWPAKQIISARSFLAGSCPLAPRRPWRNRPI